MTMPAAWLFFCPFCRTGAKNTYLYYHRQKRFFNTANGGVAIFLQKRIPRQMS